ncbi:hypothetical protein PGTUg99_000134 [Puccinia graminis f. sp. tritici]|uniref:Uncharacterized protein n=1 Tax=Puccinia graminis f. sp. tritici TaxID=56615 RepID=A0A5B0NXL2_PUCGR|nr:hypothetical protein PGTUg99_000134 [Puccinia graminis f. sp. tritici]
MDVGGKIVFTRKRRDLEIPDGQKLNIQVRELGTTEVFAQTAPAFTEWPICDGVRRRRIHHLYGSGVAK